MIERHSSCVSPTAIDRLLAGLTPHEARLVLASPRLDWGRTTDSGLEFRVRMVGRRYEDVRAFDAICLSHAAGKAVGITIGT
jgi:hypothetical protein